MGWVTLTLRKQTLRAQMNSYEFQDLTLSMQRRSLERQKSYDLSSLKVQQASLFAPVKDEYQKAKDEYQDYLRNKYSSDEDDSSSSSSNNELNLMQMDYQAAKEKYEEDKAAIEDYIDTIKEEVEAEATDKETKLDEEQTEIESILQSVQKEMESVDQQIGTDVQNSAIKFGN